MITVLYPNLLQKRSSYYLVLEYSVKNIVYHIFKMLVNFIYITISKFIK